MSEMTGMLRRCKALAAQSQSKLPKASQGPDIYARETTQTGKVSEGFDSVKDESSPDAGVAPRPDSVEARDGKPLDLGRIVFAACLV
jgi:hypothetical protein